LKNAATYYCGLLLKERDFMTEIHSSWGIDIFGFGLSSAKEYQIYITVSADRLSFSIVS
jgi:hypothetical protein